VAAAFVAAERSDPRLDHTGKPSTLLQRQSRGHTNCDRGTKSEKAITASVLRRMWEIAKTPQEKHLARLAIGAFFFAMRSCEYLTVSGERRTKRVCIRNIRFYRGHEELSHDDPDLAFCDSVTITFEYQKRDERDETVTMYATGDTLLCPVRAWASIVQIVLHQPKTNKDTPCNTVFLENPNATNPNDHSQQLGKFVGLTGKQMISLIRRAAKSIGSKRLGFDPKELGTHSIRSGAAMAMHLDGVPVYSIMLIGRWSSDAFLRYLRPQVKEFTQHIAKRMIQHQHFFSVPTFDPHAAPMDPSQANSNRPFVEIPSLLAGGQPRLLPRVPFNIHT
jgi:hypothetical protein